MALPTKKNEVKKSIAKTTVVTQETRHAHKGGELLIKFKPFADPAVIAQIGQAYGKELKELKTKGNVKKLIVKDQLNLDSALLELKQIDAAVEWVEPNYLLTKSSNTVQVLPSPNDPSFSAQWALENTGQDGGTPTADIRAKSGWAKTTGSRNTVVAVIDTGVDLNHPDLKNNLWVNQKEKNGKNNKDDDNNGFTDDVNGWNFVNDTPNPQDDHGHGTAMAGLIAAEGNNAAGITGVMWQGTVMPLKALDATGSGYVSDVVDALDYAIAQNVSVINCSFGTAANSQALSDAIARTASAGILVVTSSGNNGQDLQNSPQYPASYTLNNLITVGATTNLDDLAPFSNYGAAVHVGAPGVGLISTQLGGGDSLNTGTSGAAALVAGVAGLLKTQRGWVSGYAIRQAILDGVRTVGQLTGKVSSNGVVNLGDSITTLLATGSNSGGSTGGNGGGNTGGGGTGGGTVSNGMNLDYTRSHTPVKPDPKVYINNLPAPGYDDPAGSSSTGSYYSSQNLPKNEVGAADGDPTEPQDPTGGGQTGPTSINLGSQNINFAAPVLSLGGRAGLGLNLAMNYNSKMWLKDTATNKIVFNSDKGYPAPGWRIGFGAIEGENNGGTVGPFLGTTGYLSYTYIEPDGSRHELNSGVNSGTPSIYTSFDSTYLEFNGDTKKLRFMNGTCITFGDTSLNDFLLMPTQIKDRNGNYITIQNQTQSNGNVVIDYIVDTLGRYIDFYYENDRLTRVRELRNANNRNVSLWPAAGDLAWYNYLVIDWQPVTASVSFSGVTLDPSDINGKPVYMPARLDYPSGHSYKCFYNSYVQMYLVEKLVPKIPAITGANPVPEVPARRVAYTRYDLPSMNATSYPAGGVVAPTVNATAQTDCPQFANRWEWAENWNLTAGVPQEANYQYSFSSGTNLVIDPLGRYNRIDTSTAGSVTTMTSRVYAPGTYAGGTGTSLKTVTTTYVQDAGPTYVSNQRVSQAVITDGSFTRKTAIAYTTVSGASLPADSDEYDAAGTTVYRRTHTDYNTSTDYSTRHIIGLPAASKVYSGAGTTLLAQVNYTYDEAYLFLNSSVDNVIQSDVTNGASSVGRANLTTTTQYSVSGGVASSPRTVGQRPVYDSQGNVCGSYDVNNNLVAYEMWDNYSNKPAGAGETHAFPARSIDQAGFQSGAKFDWFTGNVVEAYHIQGTSSSGIHQNVVTYNYDFADRRIAEIRPDGGYTTYNYWDNWMAFATYTLIEGTNTNYSYKNYDGAGRTIRQGGDLADGVASKFTATNIEYDNVGRPKRTTNPTAINGSFAPIDEDAVLGFQWTTTTYDALDRPTVMTHPDGDAVNYSYLGCGCAGSSTVEVTDERGKKRRTIKDNLGRLMEAYDLSPAGATYSRAAYSYTPLDQMTTIAHYDNGTVKHQDRTFAYDGYGRLTNQTTPEAGATGYNYTALDQVLTATLANSSTRTFAYNTRGLVSDITYNGTLTQNVHYDYDEYGARTLMQEKNPGSGAVESSTSYAYNSFEQLQTETRNFKGLTGTYSVGYQYNLAGGVKTMTYTAVSGANSFVKNVNYAYNNVGGLSGIGTNIRSGGAANDTTNVMSGFQYRGFGAVKQANYGNGKQMTANYDAKRLQMTYLSVHAASNINDKIVSLDYNYYNGGSNNGRIQKITDYLDAAYTTTYSYDDQNRLSSASATAVTRSYTYDPWANLLTTSGTGPNEWGYTPTTNYSYTLNYATNASGAPATNRLSNQFQYYDNAGNMTVDLNGHVYTYDAANRIKSVGNNKFMEYDGDGHRVLSDESAIGNTKFWYLWSSVLNQPVVELGSTGAVFRAYVYNPGGGLVAQQSYDQAFHWVHQDQLGSGHRMTDSAGAVVYTERFDPHGQSVLRISNNGPFYQSHKFTGYERDYGTNTDNAMARQYHHNNGRFMQPDPLSLGASDLSNPQSLNLYSYVQNDPVNNIDPSGMDLIPIWGKACVGNGEIDESILPNELSAFEAGKESCLQAVVILIGDSMTQFVFVPQPQNTGTN